MVESKEKTYTMSEVMAETGLSADTLRYYEKDGILPVIGRKPNGHRFYSQQDRDWLNFVLCLRSTGMSTKKIKLYRELMVEGDRTAGERRNLLVCQREQILEERKKLKVALNHINYKIQYYEEIEAHLE